MPRIFFARGSSHLLPALAELPCEVLSVDWTIRLSEARKIVGPGKVLQGNLDPAALLGPATRSSADRDACSTRARAARTSSIWATGSSSRPRRTTPGRSSGRSRSWGSPGADRRVRLGAPIGGPGAPRRTLRNTTEHWCDTVAPYGSASRRARASASSSRAAARVPPSTVTIEGAAGAGSARVVRVAQPGALEPLEVSEDQVSDLVGVLHPAEEGEVEVLLVVAAVLPLPLPSPAGGPGLEVGDPEQPLNRACWIDRFWRLAKLMVCSWTFTTPSRMRRLRSVTRVPAVIDVEAEQEEAERELEHEGRDTGGLDPGEGLAPERDALRM